MHDSVIVYVAQHVLLARDTDVLEVGSYDVNGGVRHLLAPLARKYVGIDVEAGPGVDEIHDGENLRKDWTDRFGLVVSTEMLEHAWRPHVAVAEMARVCESGGHVLVTCRGFDMERGSFPAHNPPDRHRPGPGVVAMWCVDAGLVVLEELADPQVPGWFVLATKP